MKNKIMIFIIGLLVGAVIASGAFYIYSRNNTCSNSPQMNGGQPPEIPSGQNGQPPEMPSGQNGQPPEMPNSSNTQSNS